MPDRPKNHRDMGWEYHYSERYHKPITFSSHLPWYELNLVGCLTLDKRKKKSLSLNLKTSIMFISKKYDFLEFFVNSEIYVVILFSNSFMMI